MDEVLDERKQKILKAIIKTYMETGEPVGSRTISKYPDLNVNIFYKFFSSFLIVFTLYFTILAKFSLLQYFFWAARILSGICQRSLMFATA